MALYDLGTYTPPPCANKIVSNRIVGAGFIIGEVENYTLPAAWLRFLGAPPTADVVDEVNIIKKVRGTMEDPTFDKGAGFGITPEEITGGTHKYILTVDYDSVNEDFMRKLLTSCPFNVGLAYVVGNKEELQVMPYTFSATPLSSITEDIKMKRASRIELTCFAKDIPYTVVFATEADKKAVIELFF
jgi:hypothetical protein